MDGCLDYPLFLDFYKNVAQDSAKMTGQREFSWFTHLSSCVGVDFSDDVEMDVS